MKQVDSDKLFCIHRGDNVVISECVKCKWFAAGSEEAVNIAERAHKCRWAMHQNEDLLRELELGC